MTPTPAYGLFRFIDPDPSVPAEERAIFAQSAPKTVEEVKCKLHDFRKTTDVKHGQAGLDEHAFTYVDHKSCLTGEEILEGDNAEKIYAQECIDLVLKVTGASRGVVHNIAFRRALANRQADLFAVFKKGDFLDQEIMKLPRDRVLVNGRDPVSAGNSEPSRHAHCDMTLDCLRETIKVCRRDIFETGRPSVEAEELRKSGAVVEVPRYAAYSVWRPLKPVKRDPIAVLDYRTVDPSELAVVDFRVPSELTDSGEYIAKGLAHVPPKHPENLKWYWMPEQQPEEVCIIKFADSKCADDDSIAPGCIHCSPIVEETEDEEARCSVETRVYAFWD